MRIDLDGSTTAPPQPLVPGGCSSLKSNRQKDKTTTTTTSTTTARTRRARTAIVTTTSAGGDKRRQTRPAGGRRRRRPDNGLDEGGHHQHQYQYSSFNLAQYSTGANNQQNQPQQQQQRQMDELTMSRIRETVGKFASLAPLLGPVPSVPSAGRSAGQANSVQAQCNQQPVATTIATTSFTTTDKTMISNATTQLVPADLSAAAQFGPASLPAPSSHFQFGHGATNTVSPLDSIMAAVAARYHQHQQQHQNQHLNPSHQQQQQQTLLSQFASLHGLSAVASAIQKQSTLSPSSSSSLPAPQRKQTTTAAAAYSQNNQLSMQNHNFAFNHNQPLHSSGADLVYLSQQFTLSNQLAQQIGRLHQQQQQQHHHQQQTSSATSDDKLGFISGVDINGQQVQTLGHLQFGRHQLTAAQTRLIDNDNQMASTTSTTAATPTTTTSEMGAPKSRKRRRGSRKCRKVYGMAQRQLWCTQCKWKKACSRFSAQQQQQQQQHQLHYQQQQQVTTTTGASSVAIAARRLANYHGKSRQLGVARNQKQLERANDNSDRHHLDISWPLSII